MVDNAFHKRMAVMRRDWSWHCDHPLHMHSLRTPWEMQLYSGIILPSLLECPSVLAKSGKVTHTLWCIGPCHYHWGWAGWVDWWSSLMCVGSQPAANLADLRCHSWCECPSNVLENTLPSSTPCVLFSHNNNMRRYTLKYFSRRSQQLLKCLSSLFPLPPPTPFCSSLFGRLAHMLLIFCLFKVLRFI